MSASGAATDISWLGPLPKGTALFGSGRGVSVGVGSRMRFRVLGSVEAWAGESRLALGGRRQVSLLAFLLVNANRPVSSDALIDGVWGPERSGAEKRLHMAVARLRRALEPLNGTGEPVLRTVSGGYLLAVGSGELDAEVFEDAVGEGRRMLEAGEAGRAVDRLRGAFGLWRGSPLAEVRFEDFAQGEIRRLEELRQSAFEMLIDAELQIEHHAAVIAELEEELAGDPAREGLVGRLMLALYRTGRQADALAVYQRTRVHLDEELGLEPSQGLQDLQLKILDHAPSLDAGPVDRSRGAGGRSLLPSGTVTFVFTDVEGSTRLLRELGGERYGEELRFHRERVREVVAAHGGVEFGTEGDGFFLAFARASDALDAAGALQATSADQQMRVRVGVHTGEPLLVDGDYVGLDVHKAARIRDAAHGGQVLVSQVTRDLAANGLRDLGEYRLKDLTAAERLFQVGDVEFPPLRTLRPTNLPVQSGPLLGRRKELPELLGLSVSSRLLTLTGPGGSGKTRLALALAGQLSDDYGDGVWWVPLAAITDPELVLPTIAQDLGARGELQDHLAGKRVLLLLDNLEQVLDCAPLIADLLGGLPELSVVATSRERLAVSLEQEYPVPPLDEAAAEELFISRARQLEPDFEPDETVGHICERLDRLPLALELASTRVKLMSTAEMLNRLEHRLDLLSRGRRDAPDRQATMRAAIGWSYDLLPKEEQALFRRLAVFAGGFELEAAEAVCDADLDGLQSLIEKSLLRRDRHRRFFLLELTRDYALEQLQGAGETERLWGRHADWYLELAQRADQHAMSAEQRSWLARLDLDTDNFRAALAWFSEHDPEGTVALATTLWRPWRMHGRHQELIPWLERALAIGSTLDKRTRAVGLRTLGDVLNFSERYDEARGTFEQSLALFRELGDEAGEASVLASLGMGFSNQGSHAKAIELHEAAIAMSRAAGDELTAARALNYLGGSLLSTGQLERSAAAYGQSLAIYTEVGWHSMAVYNVSGLAEVALAQSDADGAERYYREALELISGFGDENNEMYAVAGLACAAALRGDRCSAGRLWAVVEATENRRGMRMIEIERVGYERIVNPAENDRAFRAGYQAGCDIDLADVVNELRASD